MNKSVIVIGSGIAGLLAAASLSKYFKCVSIIERDKLPFEIAKRKGVPQGDSFHALLAGGYNAIEKILPGFGADLESLGAVKINIKDFMVERPGFDPYPQRDVGISMYCMSRPLLEHCLKKRILAISNIIISEEKKVEKILYTNKKSFFVKTYQNDTYIADFIVDASGNSKLTFDFLNEHGYKTPQEEKVSIDIHYTTAFFDNPNDNEWGWKAYRCIAERPKDSRGFIISPIENNRLICTLSGRGDQKADKTVDSFFDFMYRCRTKTGFNALKKCTMLDGISKHGLKYSRRRYFENLVSFPNNYIPIGDILAQINPIYGHGMSLAAIAASQLDDLFAQNKKNNLNFSALNDGFFSIMSKYIDTAWKMSTYPDLMYPDAEGNRPKDLYENLKYMKNIIELGSKDPGIDKLHTEVLSLISLQEKLFDHNIAIKIENMMKNNRLSV